MNDFASAAFRIIRDVPEALRLCECGTPRVVINRVISEQLDIVPMQVRVLQHIRLVYGCAASEHAPVTVALPPQPLPKSNAAAQQSPASIACNGLIIPDSAVTL